MIVMIQPQKFLIKDYSSTINEDVLSSIFKDSKRLTRLLGSIKVDYEDRPLTPIQVANELKSVCDDELNGDTKEAKRRFDLSESMWSGFMRLLTLTPEIQEAITWGASDSEKLGLGFTAAHFMAKFKPEYQRIIMDMSWENERPLRKEELKKISQLLGLRPKDFVRKIEKHSISRKTR